MITNTKKAMEYLNKNKKGPINDLTRKISSETIITLQTLGDLSVNCFDNKYEFTNQGQESYKYIYSNKTSLWDGLLGLFCHYVLRY